MLREAHMDAGIDPSRGLDHGVWVPLKLMFPGADIPVVQLSVQTEMNAQHHWDLGQEIWERCRYIIRLP